MQINTLSLSHPIQWLNQGWKIFVHAPMQWIAMVIVFFMITFALQMIPFIGQIISMLIYPVLLAGLLRAAQSASHGEPVHFLDIFSIISDSDQRVPFLKLGILILLFQFVLMMVIFLPIMGTAGMGHVFNASEETMGNMAAGGGLIAVIFMFASIILYLMALVYAVPLMLFHKTPIIEALTTSIRASFSNILPMFAAGVIFMILAFIAIVPLGLGLLILIPVSIGALYVSYRDIFTDNQ